MSTSIETLERALVTDLRSLGDRLADERTVRDLYRALAGRRLTQRDSGAYVALSYKRAEELLTEAGVESAQGLANSGGEGEVTDRAREVLEEMGWESRPEDTSRHDPAHVTSPEDPPPASRPDGREPPEWERTAHEEAERNRLRRL
jgi:hypothetical protein